MAMAESFKKTGTSQPGGSGQTLARASQTVVVPWTTSVVVLMALRYRHEGRHRHGEEMKMM